MFGRRGRFATCFRSPGRPARRHSGGSGYRGNPDKSWRSESPMRRGGRMNRGRSRGGRGFRRSPGRFRDRNDRSSSGLKRYRHHPIRDRRFSPSRNRRRSLSRKRSISPRNERRHMSSNRNEDRSRPHDRSRKSFDRSSPLPLRRSSISPCISEQKKKGSLSPRDRWDRNQMSPSDRGGSHHDDMYRSRNMDSRSGNEFRQRGFSPGRNQMSDIDERMQRSNSPYNSDRLLDNEMGRGYKGDGPQMKGNDSMSNNQGFKEVNYSGNNRPDFQNRDGMNSGFNIMINEAPKPYTQEELKKITVDIYRNVPSEPVNPNKRLFINPEDVIVVRRSGEGARPIFDRDEIRQAQQAKDISFERRVVAIVNDPSTSPQMNPQPEYPGSEERENFQINTEHFNAYSNSNPSTRQSLNDRWHRMQIENMNMGRKNSRQLSPCPDIPGEQQPDERGGDLSARHRSRSPSPISRRSDSRFGRRSSFNDEHRNKKYFTLYERRDRFTNDSSSNKQFDHVDLRRRNTQERNEQKMFFGRGSNANRGFRPRNDRGFESKNPNELQNEIRGDAEKGLDDEKLPNFSVRPDKYQYQEWLEKPDVVPKGPSYFEHDNRGERKLRDSSSRGGGGGGGGRGGGRDRGFRGRPVRGRGFVPRGRRPQTAFIPKNKWSPNHWQHDMFESSPDQNKVQDNNPSSTTGSK